MARWRGQHPTKLPATVEYADAVKWESARLTLEQIPVEVLQRRLLGADFSLAGVHYPAAWPGDALPIFPMWLAQRKANPDGIEWGGMIIERASCQAIGTMGAKGHPIAGQVEIGYGLNPEAQGKGYATEIALVFTEWLLAQPNVREVWAETHPQNRASQRVLEKCGFVFQEQRPDPTGGFLNRYRLTPEDRSILPSLTEPDRGKP